MSPHCYTIANTFTFVMCRGACKWLATSTVTQFCSVHSWISVFYHWYPAAWRCARLSFCPETCMLSHSMVHKWSRTKLWIHLEAEICTKNITRKDTLKEVQWSPMWWDPPCLGVNLGIEGRCTAQHTMCLLKPSASSTWMHHLHKNAGQCRESVG